MPSLTQLPSPTSVRLPNDRDLFAPTNDGAIWRTSKALLMGAYKRTGMMSLHEAIRARMRSPYMTVLLLHRVTDQIEPDGLTVTTRWFRDFCKLMKASYNVVSVGEVNRYLQSGETPPRRTVAITFDDSYADNFAAARVLHEHGLPATFFIPTHYVDTTLRFPWDAHLPTMPNLTWNQVRQMAEWGHEIGSHSVTHPNFGTLDVDESLKELIDSRATLEDKLQRPVTWFAFPFGAKTSFRPDHSALVKQAGYEGCFSAVRGAIEMDMYGQVLPRQAVPYFRNLTHLELYVNRCLDWFYGLKRQLGAA